MRVEFCLYKIKGQTFVWGGYVEACTHIKRSRRRQAVVRGHHWRVGLRWTYDRKEKR